MVRAFIAVGSNLGDRHKNLVQAKVLLEKILAIKILRSSPIYETEPVGGPPQGKYLNAVWEIETTLVPQALLEKLLAVEAELGRVRREANAPRTLDLDILFYGDQIIDWPGLTIPHPRLHDRTFVLEPLADIAPDVVHPKLMKTVRVLLEELLERNSKS